MMPLASSAALRTRSSELPISLGLIGAILFFVISGSVSYWNTRTLWHNSQEVAHSEMVIAALDELLSLVKDAETGQRGYLLTGDQKYLAPYTNAVPRIDEHVRMIEYFTQDNPRQHARIAPLQAHIKAKLDELHETILLRRNQDFEAARSVVVTDRGKSEMDNVRLQVAEMTEDENLLRRQRFTEMEGAYRAALFSGVATGLLGVFLSGAVGYLVRRAALMRERQEWLQSGQVGLGNAMFGEQRMEQLGENILAFLAKHLDAYAGALFVRDGRVFRRVALYGVPPNASLPERFETGEGLLGQAAKDKRSIVMRQAPEGYLTVGSALGRGNPTHIVIAPAKMDDTVNAVLEFGFIHALSPLATDLLELVSEPIGIAVKSANYRLHLQNLLEETQRQAEELQSQSEELRVSNEELEEQSRALKESQLRLEQQHAELEQTNAQLEEQAQTLEDQRDNLARTKASVQRKAHELEQASRYKSDFLANMSHELRTPLNSLLILAKLLADNPHGNLSEEQIAFARTIQASGNDLLTLINDILDLSKIEAGHMEVRPEYVTLQRLLDDLARTFDPIARQKGLRFNTHIAPQTTEGLETDRQRLEQILRNLLANAMKFTEQGSVTLTVEKAAPHELAFILADTGIGIAPEQQRTIFQAFRQADGTISRKYGGTGLGLSISRELARLLGGRITLQSEPGKGSRFSVFVPKTYDASLVMPHRNAHMLEGEEDAEEALALPSEHEQRPLSLLPYAPSLPPPASLPLASTISRVWRDDRKNIRDKTRVILVIEDDESFTRILYDLAHEINFQCLLAHTAEEGLRIATQYLPSAIVLDVGLPDNSGLSVLDRLKRDARTRHIPVHVVSAGDYAQTALSLGAVGYMLKPVKRNDLIATLKRLETKLAQRMRRVLIVEDDAVQCDSMGKLLGSHDVETVGVGTAASCLAKLKESTFDCMVLDLSLPDASGYSLLETLSREDAYSFPPVIVYTGGDLSADEEQRLRRYSKSIIIKGAKSPERLLDEVTLFLHKVVAELPPEQQKMLEKARGRDAVLEGRRILVVEDDVRNVYALTSIFEPHGALVRIARNGKEALSALEATLQVPETAIDLVLMDVMMPEMDGFVATRAIRQRREWRKLPIIMLTAKAMKDDQERCLEAGANDYMAKPLDVEKLLSLVRVWMPR